MPKPKPHLAHSNSGTNFKEAFCGLVDLVRYTTTRQADRQGQAREAASNDSNCEGHSLRVGGHCEDIDGWECW